MKPKCLLVLGVLLLGVTAAASLIAAQKPVPPPQPTEQQKLKERVDALESQLKETQAKADRAAMEKDYIERIQKEVNTYYEKAFNSQMVIIGIIGLLLAVGGTLGVNHLVQSELTEASTTLREGFRRELADELQKLKDSNAAQVKELENALTKRINQADADLETMSDFQFQFAQGLAFLSTEKYEWAIVHLREALAVYNFGRDRQVIDKSAGGKTVQNILWCLRTMDETNYTENIKKELASGRYDNLNDELNEAAIELAWLGPLILEKKLRPPTAQPATPPVALAPTQESPTPANPCGRPALGQFEPKIQTDPVPLTLSV